MGSVLNAPSPVLAKFATVGVPVGPAVTVTDTRTGHRRDSTVSQPYRFIYRISSRKHPASPKYTPHKRHCEACGVTKVGTPVAVQHKRVIQLKNKKKLPPSDVAQHVGEQSAHLSDVVEVIIADDPTFAAPVPSAPATMQATEPYVFIVEQPSPKSLRFRYECEGRSAGSIPGVSSTPENRTFPAIKVCGYRGCMVIVVSLVTKDEPYKPHPHNLVGRDCQMGVCTVKVPAEGDADSRQVQFRNLGIQCVKRRDIGEALRVRQELRVNPFKTGYAHKNQPQSIDLNAVRLCFQVFLTDDAYKVQRALQPVVSEVVYDKKAMSDLLIVRSSHCSGPARGGTSVILLCEKVTREDTEVWFVREEADGATWTERVPPEYVHKQLALVFKTPPYRDPGVGHHVTVQFHLHRISDNAKSNVYSFEYIPEGQDIEFILGTKRRKKQSYNLQDFEDRSLSEMPIKTEPRDPRTPPHPMNTPGYGDQWRGDASVAGGPSWYQSPPEHYYTHQNVPGVQIQHVQGPVRSPMGQSVSPMGQLTPMGQTLAPMASPMGQAMSPMGQAMSPMGQALSPMGQALSPMGQALSPMGQALSPMGQAMSPMVQCVSPASVCMSPVHGAVSPNMMQMTNMVPMQSMAMAPMAMHHGMAGNMDPVMADVVQHPTYAEVDPSTHSTPSLSALLMTPGDDDMAFNSGDLANLSSMLNERGDLSDSLNRLSTRDLLQP